MSTSALRLKAVPNDIVRWFLAELIGTMFLAATAGVASVSHLGLDNNYVSLYVPFAVGGVVMVLVYLFGHVSGAHLNPAVSAGLFAFRKISVYQMISDFIAQFLGAWIGIKLMIQLMGVGPLSPVATTPSANMGEFVGAAILAMTVTTFVLGKIKAEVAGIIIGASLMVGLTLAMITGAGVLNPAVAIAFGAQGSVTYILMPILGGVVGAAVAVLFNLDK